MRGCRGSREVRPDVHQEIVLAVVTPAAHFACKRLGLRHVLLAVSLHAVGVSHRLSTQLARVHWAAAAADEPPGWRRRPRRRAFGA